MSPTPPDVRSAIDSLPRDHLVILRAALAGFEVDDLATLARVPPEALGPLLQLATAKLDRALEEATGTARPTGGPGRPEQRKHL